MTKDINDEYYLRNEMSDQFNSVTMGNALEPTKGAFYVTNITGKGRTREWSRLPHDPKSRYVLQLMG